MHTIRRRPLSIRGTFSARIGVLLAAAILLVAACGDDDEPTATTAVPETTEAPATTAAPDRSAETHRVDIGEFLFEPGTITVSVGDSVIWENSGDLPHTTTAGTPGAPTGEWDSGTMSPGDLFSMSFATPGTFQYFCTIHPNQMQATITVTEG